MGDKDGLPKVNALAQGRTPIASKADALAALDLIRDETIQPGHHLVIAMIAALRRKGLSGLRARPLHMGESGGGRR